MKLSLSLFLQKDEKKLMDEREIFFLKEEHFGIHLKLSYSAIPLNALIKNILTQNDTNVYRVLNVLKKN